MKNIDALPDYEFREVFRRVTTKIDLRGANTPQEINQLLYKEITAYPPRHSKNWIAFLKRLIPSFGVRAINEAIANPRGLIALTFRYGKKTADRIIMKQARNKLESLHKEKKNKK